MAGCQAKHARRKQAFKIPYRGYFIINLGLYPYLDAKIPYRGYYILGLYPYLYAQATSARA